MLLPRYTRISRVINIPCTWMPICWKGNEDKFLESSSKQEEEVNDDETVTGEKKT